MVGAVVILVSVLPRRDRFTPPGPLLDLDEHPRLRELIERVAAATGQEVPREIYLVPDVNAFVTQRGGLFGVGSTRVMGLGLPLMSRLTTAQFAAVLAHEFGHYHGGDTALGPWIYRTREAIGRTLENLGEHSSLLQWPFRWYAHLYMRITQSISRAQEYAADALAARAVGGGALAGGLRAIFAAAQGFGPFWHLEYAPVINSGYRVSVTDGLDAFMRSPKISGALDESLEREIATGAADPFDTHPSLRERLAAIDDATVAQGWENDSCALTLLEDLDAIESSLLDAILVSDPHRQMPTITWDQVPELVWAPLWRKLSSDQGHRLKDVTPGLLTRLEPQPPSLAVALQFASNLSVASPEHVAEAEQVLGAGLATALIDRGWSLSAGPGEEPTLASGEIVLRPFQVWTELCDGTLDRASWQRALDEHQLSEAHLVPGVAATGTASVSTPTSNAISPSNATST